MKGNYEHDDLAVARGYMWAFVFSLMIWWLIGVLIWVGAKIGG